MIRIKYIGDKIHKQTHRQIDRHTQTNTHARAEDEYIFFTVTPRYQQIQVIINAIVTISSMDYGETYVGFWPL